MRKNAKNARRSIEKGGIRNRGFAMLLIAAILCMAVSAAPVIAAEPDCGVAAYLPRPVSEYTDYIGGWESTEALVTGEGGTPDWTIDVYSPASWGGLKTESGSVWKAGWDDKTQHQYNSRSGTVSVQYPCPWTDGDQFEHLTLGSFITTADVQYIVIGVKSNVDTDNLIMYAGKDWADADGNSSTLLSIKKGFHEYICPTTNENQSWGPHDNKVCGWNSYEQINQLRFSLGGELKNQTFTPIELEFSYVRFVGENYDGTFLDVEDGTRIENGAENYAVPNQIVNFSFLDDLQLDTVTEAHVTINGTPVEWVMTSDIAPNVFRANLGTLRKNKTYTVRFDGVRKSDGSAVTDTFTFSTPTIEPIRVTPELHSVNAQTGVVGGWECTETPKEDMSQWVKDTFANAGWFHITSTSNNDWFYSWYTSMRDRYNTETGSVSVEVNPKYNNDDTGGNDANPDISLTLGQSVSAANAKYVVIGVNASRAGKMTVYNTQNANADAGLSKVESPAVISFQKGFNECIYPLDAQAYSQIDSLRFSHAPTGFDPYTLEFSYVRFVDDTYQGLPGKLDDANQIAYTPFMEYGAKNNLVGFKFPFALDLSTVEAENITLNGIAADYVLTNADDKTEFRAYFSSMQPISRCRLQILGVQNAENTDLMIDEYRFTTRPIEDTAGTTAPMLSWELVENYKTENEALLTKDTPLAGKTITAVTGGLYNNSAEDKVYALMLARYKDGRLDNVEFARIPLRAHEMVGEKTLTVTLPENADAYTFKALAWNFGNADPLCRVITPADSVSSKPLKVLILGNSITKHAPDTNIGWYGNWGMAASAREKDYVHQLIAKVKGKYPLLQVKYQNIATIENRFTEEIAPQVRENDEFQACADFKADIIIMTIGANIHVDKGTFTKDKYGEMISAFQTNPDAKVIVGMTTLTGEEVKSILSGYAAEHNCPLVDMAFTRGEHPEYFPKDGDYGENGGGVCLHPNDAGMEVMASKLAGALWSVIDTYHAK